MKIVIIENNISEIKNIENALSEWKNAHNIEITLISFTSGEDFFSSSSNYDSNTDLFILDVKMGAQSGIDVAKQLRAANFAGEIIFLTSFREFVFDGYEVHAFNFLVKPLDKSLLFKCLDELLQKHSCENYIFRDATQSIITIPYCEIVSFSVNRHIVYISTIDKTYTQYQNLTKISEELPPSFIRIHRSCIINLYHVLKLCSNRLYLSNGSVNTISRTYLSSVRDNLMKYAFERAFS